MFSSGEIQKFGKLVFSRGSIFERYLTLLRKAKRLDNNLPIQKLMKSFVDSPSVESKNRKIKRIKLFIKGKTKRRKK